MTASTSRRRFSSGRIITCALSSLFLSLTVLFFFPMELILNNIREFHFSFHNIWWFQLLAATGAAAILTLVLLLLPRKISRFLTALTVGGGLAAWIQAMLLNGGLTVMTGEEAEVPRSQVILNAAIWVLIIAGFVFAMERLMKRRNGTAQTVLRVVSGLLIIMQGGGLISLAATTDTSAYTVNYRLTDEDLFVLGQGTNVVEIILDTADNEYTEQMLEKYPELYDSLSGWVYYPNATSTYSRTYPSLTYLLSGEKCYCDTEPEEFVSKTFSGGNFMKTLRENGTDVFVYSWHPEMVGDEGIKYVANGKGMGNEREELDYYQLEKHLIRIGLHRGMPYALKNLFAYQLDIINISSFVYRPYSYYMDPAIYGKLQEEGGVTVSDRYQDTFKLYHLWSSHSGAYWNNNLKKAKHPVYSEVLRGSFRFVETYIDALRNAGVYDQTLLIVTADHGMSGGDRARFERNRAACPLLMVKYPGSDLSQPLTRNHAPVSHDDLFETIRDALSCGGDPVYGSGKKLSDYREGESRIRTHYYTALDEDLREVALVEYEIDGDAADFSSWHETGNYWDVQYSLNPRSDLKYEDRPQAKE